jgi:hypothetical protein
MHTEIHMNIYIYIPMSYGFLWLMRNIEESATLAYLHSVQEKR